MYEMDMVSFFTNPGLQSSSSSISSGTTKLESVNFDTFDFGDREELTIIQISKLDNRI